jgi:signal transduction histidine kinase
LVKQLPLKRFVTLLIFYFAAGFCKGQAPADSAQVLLAEINRDTSLFHKTLLYIDSSSSLPVADVLQKKFSPLADFAEHKRMQPRTVPYTFYLKTFLTNNTTKNITAYLFPGSYFKSYDIYKLGPQAIKINNVDSFSGYRKITLSAGEAVWILAKLKPLKNEFNNINPVLINGIFINEYKQYIVGRKTDTQIFGFVLSGVLLMMILFMLSNFVISKKKEFLYNACYSICMFLLIFLNSTSRRSTTAFTSLYYSYIDFFLLVTGVIFYISFTRKFLDTRANYQLLDNILKYGEQFVLLLLCIYTYLNFFTATYLPQFYLEISMKIFILSIGCAFIYLALKRRDKLFNYIAAGNAMLVFFSIISLVLLSPKIKIPGIYGSAIFYYNLGIVLELVFFLLGLTYKNRSELIKGIKEQEALKLEAERLEFETQLAVIKAQQEERNRISADMHDDLGAGMTTIRLYSELAKSKLPDNTIPEIDKISHSANELLNKMNAIIWSMSSSNDSLGNMIAYIRSYALEYFEDTGIKCKIDIPENLPNIQVIGEIRRNVFMVVKEALNNILKHANATEVSIRLTRVENNLILYIHDNGKGIDLETIRQFGNGLKNMKKRMNDLDIDFSIENKNGTLITLNRKVNTF